jgi:putative nucleotidyltransferase with HDIG domain
MTLFKRVTPRRTLVRRTIATGRSLKLSELANADVLVSALLWVLFVVGCIVILSFELAHEGKFRAVIALSAVVLSISIAAAIYICHYQERLVRNHARAVALVAVFLLLLAATKLGVFSSGPSHWVPSWGTGTAIVAAIILVIAYDQRFAVGMGTIYCMLACLAVGPRTEYGFQLQGIGLFLTMVSGVATCCFSLKEIRTRMKLLEVSALTAAVVFLMALSVKYLSYMGEPSDFMSVLREAGYHSGAAFLGGLLMQSLLPLIEKMFRIATSMTLLDYSDANQPLLKRLAMEAPGTFSHSLLIGSIGEAAAEAIDCNGLLCRVGAYYHDIGKINKPKYFVENEMGSASRHKELSPAMSQLIIVGHVKDGVEMAREYGLPTVLHQFVETHHGTTLVEPFYIEAKKKAMAPPEPGKKPREAPPCESEFRYAGPKPKTKEAAIVMLADAVEGAVRSLPDVTLTRVEAVVHNIAMRRLQDGQFDECDLTLRELSRIEASMSKALAAHYHGRIAYPTPPDEPAPSTDSSRAPVVDAVKT